MYKQVNCPVCQRMEKSILEYIKKAGKSEKVRITSIYVDEEEGLALFSMTDLGKIPSVLFFKDDQNTEEDKPLAAWDGEADWRELVKLLEEL